MTERSIHVPGFRIGTAEDRDGLTGVTVILAPEEGAAAGVDVRGCAPARGRPICFVRRRPQRKFTR